MNKLKDCGLSVKKGIHFPANVVYYRKQRNKPYVKKPNTIPKDKIILNEELKHYEKLLFPTKY